MHKLTPWVNIFFTLKPLATDSTIYTSMIEISVSHDADKTKHKLMFSIHKHTGSYIGIFILKVNEQVDDFCQYHAVN